MRVMDPTGSYGEHCLEVGATLEMGVFGHVVCDIKAAAKNNPGEIHRVVGVSRILQQMWRRKCSQVE